MDKIIKDWKKNARRKEDQNFFFIKSLKMKDPDRVDPLAKKIHKEAFEKIDCLKCGNCCKTSKPVVTEEDISNIGEYLKISPGEVKDKYLQLDDENDWEINALPCPFLNLENNKCQIYPVRPDNCKGFPYTDKDEFATRSYMHSGNSVDCPAVYYILEEMKRQI